jgi:dipeptidyl aminopeptidase/acylaminoacyl peptidase
MTHPTTRRLSPADSFRFQNAADAQIARDGSRLCFLLTRRDRLADEKRTVLMHSADRRTWSEVPGSEGCLLARWAPDNRRLAFIRRAGGKSAVVVHDAAGDMARTLTEAAAPLRELAWSPDGARLAFQRRIDEPLPPWLGVAAAPEGASWAAPIKFTRRLFFRHDAVGEWPEGCFQAFVAAADGASAPRQVTSGTWWNGMPHLTTPGLTWSVDGTELLFTGTRRPDWDRKPSDIDIHAVRVDTGEVRQITSTQGLVSRPCPSPDGRWLAYTAADESQLSHKPRRLFVMPWAGGEPRCPIPAFDRSIDEIAWSADSTSLVVSYDDAGRREIARVSLAGEIARIAGDVGSSSIERPYPFGGFSVAADGTVAYVRSTLRVPSEVAVVRPSGPAETLTALNAGLAQEVGGFLGAETFWVEGGEGRRVQCWLMTPPGPGPHPLILEIHGGPYTQYGDRFSMAHQMLAAAGYAVLFVNPCGSTGYGEAFASALHDRFPGPDYEDLMAATDAASARPDIDRENLFITGVSGGGVLTLWAVSHTSRFRAAVSIKPVASWESWLLTADMGPTLGPVWMGNQLPWENPDKYRTRSPLAHLHKARTPTMLVAGEADSRTPADEAIQAYTALKLLGIETALVRFPGATHSSWAMRPSHFAAEISAMLGWFERFRGARS